MSITKKIIALVVFALLFTYVARNLSKDDDTYKMQLHDATKGLIADVMTIALDSGMIVGVMEGKYMINGKLWKYSTDDERDALISICKLHRDYFTPDKSITLISDVTGGILIDEKPFDVKDLLKN